MNTGRTIFAQLMDLVPLPEFRRCVDRYQGDYKSQSFSALDQFLCLAFAQLTYRESLRDIEACLRVQQPKLYHMGIRGRVSRTTLAYANEHRDWRIFGDFAQGLIRTARELYRDEPLGIDFADAVYAFDSTTIDLCLTLFPCARFRRHNSDVKVLDQLFLEPGAFYLLDRGYVDFARLYTLTQACAFFVTRAKGNAQFYRRCSHPVDKSTGVRSDQTIMLTGPKTSRLYPHPLRRIHYFDAEKDLRLIFLTNNFPLPALIIAQLYRARWRVELFFRWIKQHLRIKAFYGTSQNAVKTQVWVAVSIYVLVAILKKRLALNLSLYTILQILSTSVFEKTPILQGLFEVHPQTTDVDPCIQLQMFNL